MFGVGNNDTRAMYFIVNDPTEKLLKFMAEENEKSRKQEMEMMKLMFSQKHPPVLYSEFLFIKTTSL